MPPPEIRSNVIDSQISNISEKHILFWFDDQILSIRLRNTWHSMEVPSKIILLLLKDTIRTLVS